MLVDKVVVSVMGTMLFPDKVALKMSSEKKAAIELLCLSKKEQSMWNPVEP